MTLSGMMNALADIQRRGDLMLEGVRNKLNHPCNAFVYTYMTYYLENSVQILPPTICIKFNIYKKNTKTNEYECVYCLL